MTKKERKTSPPTLSAKDGRKRGHRFVVVRRQCKNQRGGFFLSSFAFKSRGIFSLLMRKKDSNFSFLSSQYFSSKEEKYCLTKMRCKVTPPRRSSITKMRERTWCFLCCGRVATRKSPLSSFFCYILQHKKDGRWFPCCDKDKQQEKPVNDTLLLFETKKKEEVPLKVPSWQMLWLCVWFLSK